MGEELNSLMDKNLMEDNKKDIKLSKKMLNIEEIDRRSNNQMNESLDVFMVSESDDSFPINDRNYFINLFKSGDKKLSFVSQKGKSKVWNRFQRIYYKSCETPYVKCKYCNDIQKNTSKISVTEALLKHKCETVLYIYDSKVDKQDICDKPVSKKRIINEKLLIKKLKLQNKTLKLIVEKCLKMIDKCLCINTYISDQKKDINSLVNDYNKTKEFNIYDDNEGDSDYEHINESIEPNIDGHESDSKSVPDYSTSEKNKFKLKDNSFKKIEKLQIVRNNTKQNITNAIKRKYKMKARIKRDPNQTYVCEWPGCEKVFNYSHTLNEHRNRHLKVKRYFCDWPGCEDGFHEKTQLTVHISKYHTNDKPFKCDQCSYSTSYKGFCFNKLITI
jgi:hypothetical protein